MPTIPPEILQFGIAGLLFIVWAYTFKHFSASIAKVSAEHNEAVKILADQTSSAYESAITDGKDLNRELMTLIRENANAEQELKSHLIRVLTRMEGKLDQPVRCPAAIQARTGDGNGQ